MYCIAESTVYAYTDRPYLVIPVYMPCSRGPDKVKPVQTGIAIHRTSILRLWKQQGNISLCLKCTKTKAVQFSKIPWDHSRDWAQSSLGHGYTSIVYLPHFVHSILSSHISTHCINFDHSLLKDCMHLFYFPFKWQVQAVCVAIASTVWCFFTRHVT